MSCIVCDKKAEWYYSPDPDIRGLGACTEHKEDVGMAYLILIQGGEPEDKHKMYKEFVASLRRKYKQTLSPTKPLRKRT